MHFDLEAYLLPLTPGAIVLALILGVSLGVAVWATGHRFARAHLFWQTAGAVVFFVPTATWRGLEGSPDWERILGTGTTFLLFVLAMNLVARTR